jgi:hypothetical protein
MAALCMGGGGAVLVQAHGSRILLQAAQSGTAQQNPDGAARPEHTPPMRPQQMKVLPRQGDAPRGTLPPASSTAEVLAELVREAGVIFAGEVYAIRMPEGEANPGTSGGLHSLNPQAVQIEFRVDHGVRGASVGSPFVLHESLEQWRQQAPPIALHDRAIVFLYPPDQSGLSAPVGGPAGVLPLAGDNQVDLSRLHALVRPAVSGTQAKAKPTNSTAENSTDTHAAPDATPVTSDSPATGSNGSITAGQGSRTAGQQDEQIAGEATPSGGVSEGKMPELDAPQAPFLAVLRDIYVLAAAQSGVQ